MDFEIGVVERIYLIIVVFYCLYFDYFLGLVKDGIGKNLVNFIFLCLFVVKWGFL